MQMKNNIHSIYQNDIYLLQALRSCGVLLKEHILQYISNHRLLTFIKNGYINKTATFVKKDMSTFIYALTQRGQRLAKQFNITKFYRSSSVIHDLAVAEKYMNLPIGVRLTWQTEKELQNVLYQTLKIYEETQQYARADEIEDLIRNKQISPTDGGYILDGRLCLYEVITSNYSVEDIKAKKIFAEIVNCPIDFYYLNRREESV